MICSNRNMLLRIFDNLISNALKHGAGNLTVSVTLAKDVQTGDTVQIRFENELHGSDVDINHIFDEFYTTDISRTKGNTGLGLAIVKQFTEILNGSISVRNADGLFMMTVLLPRQ